MGHCLAFSKIILHSLRRSGGVNRSWNWVSETGSLLGYCVSCLSVWHLVKHYGASVLRLIFESKVTYFLSRLWVDADPDITLFDLVLALGLSSIVVYRFRYLSLSIEYLAFRVSSFWGWYTGLLSFKFLKSCNFYKLPVGLRADFGFAPSNLLLSTFFSTPTFSLFPGFYIWSQLHRRSFYRTWGCSYTSLFALLSR